MRAVARRLLSTIFHLSLRVDDNYRKLTREEFKKLFETWFEDVRRYILYRCGDGDLATDITQDVFMRIWEKQMKIEPETAKYLLIKIAGDLFVSRYRREKKAFDIFSTWQPAEKSLTPEDELNFRELKMVYEEALKTMPDKQRTVFLMNRIDNLKYREIAATLQLSEKAVEKRMSQALQHLKGFLGKMGTFIFFILMSRNHVRLNSILP
jgi:RNA polymerase sigma-70 factor (family 1)